MQRSAWDRGFLNSWKVNTQFLITVLSAIDAKLTQPNFSSPGNKKNRIPACQGQPKIVNVLYMTMFCHFYFKHQECYSLNQLKWPGGRSSLSKSLYMIVDNPAAKMPKYVTFTKTSRAWLVPPNRSNPA